MIEVLLNPNMAKKAYSNAYQGWAVREFWGQSYPYGYNHNAALVSPACTD